MRDRSVALLIILKSFFLSGNVFEDLVHGLEPHTPVLSGWAEVENVARIMVCKVMLWFVK